MVLRFGDDVAGDDAADSLPSKKDVDSIMSKAAANMQSKSLEPSLSTSGEALGEGLGHEGEHSKRTGIDIARRSCRILLIKCVHESVRSFNSVCFTELLGQSTGGEMMKTID